MTHDRPSVRDRVRELFLLDRAGRASAALTDDVRAVVRGHVAAAQRRWQVARNLADPAQRPVALGLYSQAVRWLAVAHLVSQGDPGALAPAESLAPEALVRRLESDWQIRQVTPPAAWGRVTPLLLASDLLLPDGLPDDQAADRMDDFEITARFFAAQLELRTPREIRITRGVRLAAGSACALALVVAATIGLVAPRNLARGKPATSSSVALDTSPAGAVDGSTSGLFGFHSALEDAPWLSIDLRAPHAIDRIVVYGRGDAHNSQSIPLALEASADGVAFAQIAVRTEPFSAGSPWVIAFKTTPLLTRFVRLRAQRHAYLVLGEVEVFGHEAK